MNLDPFKLQKIFGRRYFDTKLGKNKRLRSHRALVPTLGKGLNPRQAHFYDLPDKAGKEEVDDTNDDDTNDDDKPKKDKPKKDKPQKDALDYGRQLYALVQSENLTEKEAHQKFKKHFPKMKAEIWVAK